MKKAHLSIGGDQKPLNGTTLAVGSPAVGVPLPSIVVSGDTAGGSSPGSSPSSPAALTRVASSDRPSERKKLEKKEKLERERQEKLEKKEQKKMEKERLEKERLESKKSPKGGDSGGKLDLFLGSKITMEKFFKKKLKEREDRKEKKEEERERERILASEVRTSSSSMSADEGGSSGSEAVAEKKKKKRRKKGKKVSKGYHSEGSNDESGGSRRSRKKHSRRGLTSSASSTGSSSTTTTTTTSSTAPARGKLDEYKDPAEREVEREEEKETESETEDSSSSDDSSTESMDEEEDGKGMLHPHARLQRRKNWTVSQEFRVLALETEEKQKPDFSFALQHKNRDKNRYGNALPNPETRVVLRGGDTDYINANYIQGEETQYIAAQAPLPNTFGDFWLMVWEQNTRVIMMLTRLTENDRTKAEIYWPRKGPLGRARGPGSGSGSEDGGWKQFGKMRVSLVKTSLQDNDEDVTIRHFRLRKDDEAGVERQVIQIHFTGWPDFGVPQNTRAFTQLLALMEGFNKEPTIPGSTESNGPIVLHCSAGLGRTGTLIAAHIAAEKLRLKRVKSKDDIDMKAIVAVLREQRSGMVQTKCQYKFLHDLLNDL